MPNRPTAASWPQAKRMARNREYNTKIEVPKRPVLGIPPEFERSVLSIPGLARAVYRDQQAKNSFQIREFDEKYTIELDRHNPEKGNAVAHAVYDAPVYTAGAIVLGAALLGGGGA